MNDELPDYLNPEKNPMIKKDADPDLLKWLHQRRQSRDKIRRMIFGDEQVDEWERKLKKHFAGNFAGKKVDLIVEDDINEEDV